MVPVKRQTTALSRRSFLRQVALGGAAVAVGGVGLAAGKVAAAARVRATGGRQVTLQVTEQPGGGWTWVAARAEGVASAADRLQGHLLEDAAWR